MIFRENRKRGGRKDFVRCSEHKRIIQSYKFYISNDKIFFLKNRLRTSFKCFIYNNKNKLLHNVEITTNLLKKLLPYNFLETTVFYLYMQGLFIKFLTRRSCKFTMSAEWNKFWIIFFWKNMWRLRRQTARMQFLRVSINFKIWMIMENNCFPRSFFHNNQFLCNFVYILSSSSSFVINKP